MQLFDDKIKQFIIQKLDAELHGENPTLEIELEPSMQTVSIKITCQFQGKKYTVVRRITQDFLNSSSNVDMLKYLIDSSIYELNKECANQFKSYGR